MGEHACLLTHVKMVNNYRHRNRLKKLNRTLPQQQEPLSCKKNLYFFRNFINRRIKQAEWARLKERAEAYLARLKEKWGDRGRPMYKRVGPYRIMIETKDLVKLFGICKRTAQYRLSSVREVLGKNKRDYVTVEEYCEIRERDEEYIRSVLNKWDEEKWARLKASSEKGYSKPKKIKRKTKRKKKAEAMAKKLYKERLKEIQDDMEDDDLEPDEDDLNDDDLNLDPEDDSPDDDDDDELLWHEHSL